MGMDQYLLIPFLGGMNIHLPLLYGYYMVIIWLLYAHDGSMVLVYMLTLIGGILMGSMEHHI